VSAETIISDSIAEAREKYTPISRRMIAHKLVSAKNLPYKEAIEIVDAYCDEHESAIPGYISSEFGIYWLKVIAVANVAIGIFFAYWGVRAFQSPRTFAMPYWAWFVITTLFVGFAVLSWVQSVEREIKGG
jgi:hypothetical protein